MRMSISSSTTRIAALLLKASRSIYAQRIRWIEVSNNFRSHPKREAGLIDLVEIHLSIPPCAFAISFRDIQTQSQTLPTRPVGASRVGVEDMIKRCGGDLFPRVGHRKLKPAVLRRGRNLDGVIRRSMIDGVADQV